MFQRPSLASHGGAAVGDSTSPSSSSRVPPSIRPSSLSRGVSIDSQDSNESFVLLSPQSGSQSQHRATPSDGDFEFVSRGDGSWSRNSSSNSLSGLPLSRNSSFTLSSPSMSRPASNPALASQGLSLPLMSRAATDYFLARAAAEEEERQAQAEYENNDHDIPPPTLSLSRNSSRGTHLGTAISQRADERTQPRQAADEEYEEQDYDDHQGEEYYDEEDDYEPELEPASPHTMAAHNAAVRQAWLQAHSSNPRPRTPSSSAYYSMRSAADAALDDPYLRQRHQASLGAARVTHKSQDTRKQKKAAAALTLQRRLQLEQDLMRVPALGGGEQPRASQAQQQEPKKIKTRPKARPTAAAAQQQHQHQLHQRASHSDANRTGARASSSSSNLKPLSNVLFDESKIGADGITLHDVAEQLASTRPAFEKHRPTHPIPSRGVSFFGTFTGLMNKSLSRAEMSDFPSFQSAFYQHHRSVLEDCFHSSKHGVRMLSITPFKSFEAEAWLQLLLNMLNEQRGDGSGKDTRMHMVFHHPPSCANAAVTTSSSWHDAKECEEVCQRRVQYSPVLKGFPTHTPEQITALHAKYAPQTFVRGSSDRPILGPHVLLVCAFLQGWSRLKDGCTYRSSNRKMTLNYQEKLGGEKIYAYTQQGAKPSFDLFQPILARVSDHTTIVANSAYLLPLFVVEYESVDVTQPMTRMLEAGRSSLPSSSSSSSSSSKQARKEMEEALARSKQALQNVRELVEKAEKQEKRMARETVQQRRLNDSQESYGGDARLFSTSCAPHEVDPQSAEEQEEDEDDPSYLRDWGSASELQRGVIQRQKEAAREAEAQQSLPSAADWRRHLEPDEIEQYLSYVEAVEREAREDAERARQEKEDEYQAWINSHAEDHSELYGADEPIPSPSRRGASVASSPRSSRFLPDSSFTRASALSSPYDEYDLPATGSHLSHTKRPTPSSIISVTPDAAQGHHHGQGFLRVWPKRHQLRQAQANKNSKLDVNYPVKPKRQERLENARNMRTSFYNSIHEEEQD